MSRRPLTSIPGSTSVHGLAANSVIDIDIVVRPAGSTLRFRAREDVATRIEAIGCPDRHAFTASIAQMGAMGGEGTPSILTNLAPDGAPRRNLYATIDVVLPGETGPRSSEIGTDDRWKGGPSLLVCFEVAGLDPFSARWATPGAKVADSDWAGSG